MTAIRDPEQLISAFLDEGPIELPERAYRAVRSTIDQTRPRATLGTWSSTRTFNRARYALAGIAILAVLIVGVGLFAQRGGLLAPGASPSATSTPLPNPSATPSAESTDAAATPPPSLAATPAAAAMQPVWRDDDDTCTMNDVAVVDDGLVAAGWCRDPEARRYGVAWHSDTGLEWRRVFEIVEEGSALVAVSGDGDGGGAVLLGAFQLFRGDHSAGFEEEQLHNPQRRGSPLLSDIARVGQNLFVVGTQFFDGADGTAAWISSNSGDDWQLIDGPTDLALTGGNAAQLMIADENGFVVAGKIREGTFTALWRYALISGWGAADVIPVGSCTDCVGPVTALIDSEAVVVEDSLWMKVGDQWRVHTIGEQQHKIDEGYAALRLEDGFIVMGIRGRTYPQDVVATSTDGAEWSVSLLNPEAGRRTEPSIRAMVEFNGRVIAVGDGVFIGPARVSDYVP